LIIIVHQYVVSAVCNRRSCRNERYCCTEWCRVYEFYNSAKSVAFGRISVGKKGGVVGFLNLKNTSIVVIKDNVE